MHAIGWIEMGMKKKKERAMKPVIALQFDKSHITKVSKLVQNQFRYNMTHGHPISGTNHQPHVNLHSWPLNRIHFSHLLPEPFPELFVKLLPPPALGVTLRLGPPSLHITSSLNFQRTADLRYLVAH